MVLTLIAEVLVGETLIAPGGAVDRATACGDEPSLWHDWMTGVVPAEEIGVSAEEPVLTAPAGVVPTPAV